MFPGVFPIAFSRHVPPQGDGRVRLGHGHRAIDAGHIGVRTAPWPALKPEARAGWVAGVWEGGNPSHHHDHLVDELPFWARPTMSS